MSATPPPGKLPPLQPPTLQQRHLRQQEQTPFQLRCNQTPFRDTDDWDTNSREGNKEHFGETGFKRKSKNRSPCRPGRYVGTAEFSFFSQMGGGDPWLWIPARQLHCFRGGRGLSCSAHSRAPAKENSGVGHPQIQSVTRSEHRVRREPPCAAGIPPAVDCATVMCAMKRKFKKQINKKDPKQNSLTATKPHSQQSHRPRSPLCSPHYMGIVDHKGFWFTIDSIF